ncbi:MAG: hypothetical protein JRF71_07855 [Deltaproteobacteria bacterium]|nr:hypothetical protein [Deltaproteobacteria bacterium]
MKIDKLAATEFCSNCGSVRNIKGILSKIETYGSDQTKRTIVAVSFHCERCHFFIRSEQFEEENLGKKEYQNGLR